MNAKTYRKNREQLGTQSEVARLLGVTRETINRRESGQNVITKEAGIAIAALNQENTQSRKS